MSGDANVLANEADSNKENRKSEEGEFRDVATFFATDGDLAKARDSDGRMELKQEAELKKTIGDAENSGKKREGAISDRDLF